jgi:NAD(P)-dependent dehydrogenase (short-subunit alcohol dehydrogenase family)
MQTPLTQLTGRTALITGGSSGIGLATARALVTRGARVLIVDVTEPPADLDGSFVYGDVGRPQTWSGPIAEQIEALGGLDYASLNAGVQSPTNDVEAIGLEDYRRVVAVNLDGVVLGARTVAPAMRARGAGAIVITASLAGLIAYPPDPIYAATKHGVIGFARGAAPHFRRQGITINVVCPALTDTAFLTSTQRAEVTDAGFPLIPVQVVADTILDRFLGGDTGEVWVCQYGRDPIRYEPRGVPGPAGGVTPPAGLSQVG